MWCQHWSGSSVHGNSIRHHSSHWMACSYKSKSRSNAEQWTKLAYSTAQLSFEKSEGNFPEIYWKWIAIHYISWRNLHDIMHRPGAYCLSKLPDSSRSGASLCLDWRSIPDTSHRRDPFLWINALHICWAEPFLHHFSWTDRGQSSAKNTPDPAFSSKLLWKMPFVPRILKTCEQKTHLLSQSQKKIVKKIIRKITKKSLEKQGTVHNSKVSTNLILAIFEFCLISVDFGDTFHYQVAPCISHCFSFIWWHIH